MKKETTIKATAIVLALAGLLHLVRILAGWDIVINNYTVPYAVSGVALVITFWLSYHLRNR